MKKTYLALLPLLFAQYLFAQTKITIDIKNKSVAIGNDPPSSSDYINISMTKGNYLEFQIKNTEDKPFEVILEAGGKKDTLKNIDFERDSFKIDNSLKYKGLNLAGVFKMSVDGTPIKKTINLKVVNSARPVTTVAGTSQAILPPNPVSPLKKTDGTKVAPVYQLGFTYYDVFALKNTVTTRDSLIDSILKTYIQGYDLAGSETVPHDTVIKMIKTNPFLMEAKGVQNRLIAVETSLRKKDSLNKLANAVNPTKGATAQGGESLVSSVGASIGGLGVTTIADGISKFLIKRGKQELSLSFFEKFKKAIDGYPDLQTLFPTTYPLLQAIDKDIYNYSAYLQNLREAFKKDINSLPKSLPGIVDNHPGYFKKHKKLEAELLGACYLAAQVQLEAHPGDILANIPDDILNKFDGFSKDSTKHYFKGSIQTLQLLNGALRDTASGDDAPYWVGIAKIRKLTQDEETFKIFMALLYQKAMNSPYNGIAYDDNGHSLVSVLKLVALKMNEEKETYNTYKQFITDFGIRADQLNKMIKADKNQPDSASVERYAAYFKATVGLLQQAGEVGNLPLPRVNGQPMAIYMAFGNQKFNERFKPYFDISNYIADMTVDISRKNYSSAINNAVFIYNEIMAKFPATDATKSKTKVAAPLAAGGNGSDVNGSANRDGATAGTVRNATVPVSEALVKTPQAPAKKGDGKADKIAALKTTTDSLQQIWANKTAAITVKGKAVAATAIDSGGIDKTKQNQFIKYTSFMAAVATAKTSDEVENAIEAAALPVGSYSIKQKSAFNISLNGYIGYAFDYDKVSLQSKYLFANGIYAPIGFSATLGLCKGNSGAFTLFASVIDVGSLASYNLKADSTSKLKQDVRLESIISPSAQLFYDIPKWPIAVGFGWRRTPKLFFSASDNTFKVIDPRNVFNVSILIDIPIATILNSPHRVK